MMKVMLKSGREDASSDQEEADQQEEEEPEECETVEEVELDVLTCMMADGAKDADIATICQTECYALVAWEKKGKGKGRGKGKKAKFGRPKYSAGIKPQLSLEDRKKALTRLKAETKCMKCGEQGHWAGDKDQNGNLICKKKHKTANMGQLELQDAESDHSSLWL